VKDYKPSITVLKPVCGFEPNLMENLFSFCDQDFPAYQVIFGVQDHNDPAITVIKSIIARFPHKDLSLVIDKHAMGGNPKVNNLVNMFKKARHDIIVIADSDICVRRDYLKAVSAPFINTKVAATTCLYTATGDNNLASRLGIMFINDWFLPSALISALSVDLKFCFGASMAIRRNVLAEIGGFETLTNFLADDYVLGNEVSGLGHKVALVPYLVENLVFEESLKSLFLHELRWARTIRSVQPIGYTMSFVTETFALSIVAGITTYLHTSSLAWTVLPIIVTLALKVALHYFVQSRLALNSTYTPWLIPARDILSLAVRTAGIFGGKVRWRNQIMTVDRRGRLSPITKKNKNIKTGAHNEKNTATQPTYV